jgi:hypothetical protein
MYVIMQFLNYKKGGIKVSKHDLDTYCGLYCGACSVRAAYNTGNMDELAQFFADNMKVERQKMECKGCKSNTVFFNCKICKMKACARDKKIEHCIECGDYPCSLFNDFKGNAKNLPHIKEAEKNLETIRSIGVDNWLKEQEELWKCPECKTPYSWYAKRCTNCGQDLKNDNSPDGE